MGKKAKESNVEESSLAERLERQHMAKLVRSGREKISRQEIPSRDERRAIGKMEAEQLKTLGRKYLAAIPKGHFLELFLGTSKVYNEWRESYGFPWPEERRATLDLREVLRFYRSRFAQGGSMVPAGADEDDILFQFASQELKDELIRHRIREKDVTNQLKAIELQKALEGWAPIEPIRAWHNTLAELILRTREKIVKALDGEHKERAELAFDDLGDDMKRLVEEQFGSNSDNHDDA